MTAYPPLDMNTLRSDLAALFDADAHDVVLQRIWYGDDGALHLQTCLRRSPRTASGGGLLFGGSLFTLADLTGAMAMSVALLEPIRQHHLLLFGGTRGGTIAFLQGATGDVSCVVALTTLQLQTIRNDVMLQRKAVRTLAVELSEVNGPLVARATLTLAARRLSPQLARRLPAVGAHAARLREIAMACRAFAVGSEARGER